MGYQDHLKLSEKKLVFAVVTFSDTRDQNSDKSGRIIKNLVKDAGHETAFYQVCKEDSDSIRKVFDLASGEDNSVEVIVTNGGTGLSARDNTIQVIEPMLEKKIEGFGELFRLLSFRQIGSSAILSRAIGGTYQKKAVFCLPGASKAVRLGMTEIILPQAAHILWEISR